MGYVRIYILLREKCNEHPVMDLLVFDTIHRGGGRDVEISHKGAHVRGNVATKPVDD